jgi:CRP-like cAMP-binding protein
MEENLMDSKTNPLMKCINQISFFDEFSNADKNILVERAGIFKKYEKQGMTIFKDGENSQSLFIILEGVINITRGSFKSDIEKPIVLAKLTRGAVFGEISLLSGNKRTTGAITKSPLVIVMEIDKKTLESFDLSIQKLFQTQMILNLVRKLDEMNEKYKNVLS